MIDLDETFAALAAEFIIITCSISALAGTMGHISPPPRCQKLQIHYNKLKGNVMYIYTQQQPPGYEVACQGHHRMRP